MIRVLSLPCHANGDVPDQSTDQDSDRGPHGVGDERHGIPAEESLVGANEHGIEPGISAADAVRVPSKGEGEADSSAQHGEDDCEGPRARHSGNRRSGGGVPVFGDLEQPRAGCPHRTGSEKYLVTCGPETPHLRGENPCPTDRGQERRGSRLYASSMDPFWAAVAGSLATVVVFTAGWFWPGARHGERRVACRPDGLLVSPSR